MPIGPLNVDSSLRVETTGRGRAERRIDSELGRIGVRNGPNIAGPVLSGPIGCGGRAAALPRPEPPRFEWAAPLRTPRRGRSCSRPLDPKALQAPVSSSGSARSFSGLEAFGSNLAPGDGARRPHLPHPWPLPKGSARDFLSAIEKSRFAGGDAGARIPTLGARRLRRRSGSPPRPPERGPTCTR